MAEFQTRAVFSVSFLVGAGLFAVRAEQLERLATPAPRDRAEHLSLVMSAITQATAAIESELSDVLLHGPGYHLGSSDANTAQLALLSPHSAGLLKQNGILRRWKASLKVLGKSLSLGHPVCREAALLVHLRNELTHYRSYWGGALYRTNLLATLMRKRFTVPPWVPPVGFVNDFPHRILVAACAQWAHITAARLLDHLGDLLGFGTSIVDHYRASGDYMLLLPPR